MFLRPWRCNHTSFISGLNSVDWRRGVDNPSTIFFWGKKCIFSPIPSKINFFEINAYRLFEWFESHSCFLRLDRCLLSPYNFDFPTYFIFLQYSFIFSLHFTSNMIHFLIVPSNTLLLFSKRNLCCDGRLSIYDRTGAWLIFNQKGKTRVLAEIML